MFHFLISKKSHFQKKNGLVGYLKLYLILLIIFLSSRGGRQVLQMVGLVGPHANFEGGSGQEGIFGPGKLHLRSSDELINDGLCAIERMPV